MDLIGKTYINKSQYLIIRDWWIKNYKKMKREMGFAVYLYPFQFFTEDGKITPEYLKSHDEDIIKSPEDDFPLWNTSTEYGIWIIKNCNIDFIQDCLKEQGYDDKFWGVNYHETKDFVAS